MRKAGIVAVGVLVLGVLAGCGGSSINESSTSSSTRQSATSTSSGTAPESAAAWLQKWQPLLSSDYGAAQKVFLAAIQTGPATVVHTGAQGLIDANARLSAAIVDAGPPPKSDAAAVKRLQHGLSKEAALLATALQSCTAPSTACQNAVTAYAKNNTGQVIPALTDLGVG